MGASTAAASAAAATSVSMTMDPPGSAQEPKRVTGNKVLQRPGSLAGVVARGGRLLHASADLGPGGLGAKLLVHVVVDEEAEVILISAVQIIRRELQDLL